jgi:NAD(P)H-nitrite reductase large subunit
MKHIVIIGNGISGITAARHIRKRSDHRITVISSETEHFFSRTALMYIYMGHLKYEHTKPYEDWFWKKNKIDLMMDHVEEVRPAENKLTLKSGKQISYDVLILATGSGSNTFEWPGRHLRGVQGLYSYHDLQKMNDSTRNISRAVIVGGGLIGVEMAEMLRSRKIEVTFLVREPEFWSNVLPLQEANLISNHIRSHHIDLKTNTQLKEIIGNEAGSVEAIVTDGGETIPCEFVGITVGVSPSIGFLKNSGIDFNRGILVNEFLQTNFSNIYAIGDCVERTYDLTGRKRIEQVWYTGRMMGEVVAQTICDQPTRYEPGPWFNSAKFFDIEYQTYGNVPNELSENEVDLYWECSEREKAIHIVWNKISGQFLGINAFGIRLRHEFFDRWLREQRDAQFIMDHFSEANFDPEFYRKHEKEITWGFQSVTKRQLASNV